jgi:hypothetical protein
VLVPINRDAHKGLHYPDKTPSIIDFVNQFKGKSTAIAWKYGIKRNLWQKRWYDHILRRNQDVRKSGEYILNNPVRRGLVEDWHEYPYCGYLDEIDILLPCSVGFYARPDKSGRPERATLQSNPQLIEKDRD